MYVQHKDLEKPDDENIKIWHYMDLAKFVALIDKKALFFARADTLPDKFEGSYSKANIKLRPIIHKDIPTEKQRQRQIFCKELRRFALINCWHMNEVESAAMWGLYTESDEGIAIQSTFKRLKESFSKNVENNGYTVFIGKVTYVDYEKEWIPEGNLLFPFFHKRKNFEHEKELRAIICKIPEKNGMADLSQEIFDKGVHIPVDIDKLIERIVMSPKAPKYFYDSVKSIVSKYDLKKEVIPSSLGGSPVF